ncbi:MAG: tRNA uridine-5-carboxymethylaminomethyl(34) synthesis GTPase MnmE [Anaerolineae bacterium]|nr:tRNA uridine-5-carboxymethylaminomethyl(34) synthesis GTPase MnmE [Anaerolineae bacterium]MDH7475221.1 tRNA uridine-5-carboxymethylaminomethyl(34) synthesis GTPase MnmE [Anaerolineae bacterium]
MDDTIAAISTPVGEGGIGIVRLSGPEAHRILQDIFRRGRKRPGTNGLQPYRLAYGHIVDPENNQVLDEVLVAYMPAPWTYTRQDIVEINCHGGIVPLRRVLELCLRRGARLAGPGEFTLRAFLNGRIDLAQAEAVLDIVRAKTAASLRVAVDQLDGRLSQEIHQIRARMVDVLSWLEASVDFAEDEIPPRDIAPDLEETQKSLERLLSTADQGIVYRQGVRTAIVGRPNVGKSSLLNALLRTSRAIVTPIPGTTRDTLEETLNLQGIPLVLVDTAGITAQTKDVVEQLGIERSRAALAQADLALVVVDGSEPLTAADHDIATLLNNKPGLLVINKCDLPVVVDVDKFLPVLPRVYVSALTGEGLDTLESAIVETVFSGQVLASDALLVSNPRHKDALQRALDHLVAARQTQARGLPADFVAIDLTAAANALGEITGETLREDLLETIFSNFCIGK